MDALLVLISLSFHFAYAASQDQRHRFVKRQQDQSSSSSSSFKPAQTPTSLSTPTPTSTHTSSPEHSLPTSIQSRIPIHSSPPPSGGGVQTAIPEHPDPKSDKGPIIGFSIGMVALVFLLIATGWILFRRYKQRKQQQATSQNVVQLQPANHSPSSITKNFFDDTQSPAPRK